jgi:alpha-L-arabinofuranosidase
LKKELYGFNTNMISGDYGYLDTDFFALTKALQPKTLRFPGGTVGNFYHWQTKGFIKSEMESTLYPQLNKRNKGNYVKLQKRRNGIISFDDFMQLCQELNITPIVVVNLWTGSPEESADWVRYAKTKGYKITHWELGNEYYLPHYANKYRTAEIYMREAKKHALAMKAVNPNIKVSVCATPIAFHKEGWLIKTAQRKWDKKLAEDTYPLTNSWYDAYTVHVYAYKAVRKTDIENMRGYLFGWIHFGIDEAMEYYEKLFPNKEMWVTEWNIANPANRVANTQLHAMYVGDFFLKMLSKPRITQANFHVIAGPGKGFPVFSRITPMSKRTFWKYGGEPESDYGDTIRRTVYYPFQLIGEAFAESDTQFAVSLQNMPMLEGQLEYKGKQMSAVQVQAIGNTETVYIFVSNRSADELTPQLAIDGKHLKKEIYYRYVANESLTATNGGNAEMEGSGEIEVRIQEWTGNSAELTIPKNSFGVIEVKK